MLYICDIDNIIGFLWDAELVLSKLDQLENWAN